MGAQGNELLRSRKAHSRLRTMLILFVCGLFLPLSALFLWTYQQLTNESFLSLRMESEALLARIDERIGQALEPEERRPFDEYSFFSVTQTASLPQKGVRYSPLAELPLKSPIPGIIGYFQVNPDQSFQTPLLPSAAQMPNLNETLGFADQELRRRQSLEGEIRRIVNETTFKRDTLQGNKGSSHDSAAGADAGAVSSTSLPLHPQKKLQDLNLDSSYATRNRGRESRRSFLSGIFEDRMSDYRTVRKEQVSIAEQEANQGKSEGQIRRDTEQPIEAKGIGQAVGRQKEDLSRLGNQIVTFESEIDPLQIKILPDMKLLFFRRVWREQTKYIQGFVVNSESFFRSVIDEPFFQSIDEPGATIRLVRDDLIIRESGASSLPTTREQLIFKRALAEPFEALSIVVSTNHLPLGGGSALVFGLSAAIVIVLIIGVSMVYRLAATQLELSEKKGDFVSAVSHELKTPLTSIRMYAEMLRSGWVTDTEKQRSYYDFIFTESERLSRLIGNVLQLSGLSRDESPLKLTAMTAAEIITLIREKTNTQVAQSGFSMSITLSDEIAQKVVAVEEDAMIRIFINLIDNAIKFSQHSERREIELGVREAGSLRSPEILFFVRDFGPGISATQQRKIFQLFYRVENELTRATPGTGIGLALVKELARRMGARVDVANCAPGAEFRVILPASRDKLPR